VVLRKTKNEYSRGLKRLYKGRNFVPKFQETLHRSKQLKRRRNRRFSTPKVSHRRLVDETMCLEHGATRNMRLTHGIVLQAHGGSLDARQVCFGDVLCATNMLPCYKSRNFVTFFPFKPTVLAQVQLENFHIIAAFLNHNFSFVTLYFY